MSKYTFIRGANPTIVWNPKTDRMLCEFIDGLLFIDDARIAKKLRELGYKETKDFPDGPPVEGFIPKKTTLAPPPMELNPSGRPAAPSQEPDLDEKEPGKTVINQKATKSKLTKKK